MKLYATTTSERASKGQGGEWLDIEIIGENRGTIGKIEARDCGGYYSLKLSTPYNEGDLLKRKGGELRIKKGKRQKGEKCISCGIIPDNLGRCKCCNKDAF